MGVHPCGSRGDLDKSLPRSTESFEEHEPLEEARRYTATRNFPHSRRYSLPDSYSRWIKMINAIQLEDKKNTSLPCSVSRKTERQVREHVRESDFESVSQYLRHLIKQDLTGDKR
ncbi:hypothetical protein GLU26_02085 [Nanohaloarchaea archaeon]|nr:hypothetical protein [Candidatus Nanohaloarchaea archaeon]